ncbi:MAG: hypothetical protein GY788_07450 [bacterium]|nr:hypothetical protein [bacterium]
MQNIELEGKIQLHSNKHTVEYELDTMTGGKTLFLRLRGEGKHNVPIYHREIDGVIQMLEKGKKAIMALDGDGIELPDETGV